MAPSHLTILELIETLANKTLQDSSGEEFERLRHVLSYRAATRVERGMLISVYYSYSTRDVCLTSTHCRVVLNIDPPDRGIM